MKKGILMKIKVIIEGNWTNEAINEVMTNPRSLEKYDDYSDRLELAALACMTKRKQDPTYYTDEPEAIIAAEDINNGIESYFYECMVDNYIEDYVAELDASPVAN